MAIAPTFRQLEPADMQATFDAPPARGSSLADLTLARMENYRRGRSIAISEFLADVDRVTADSLALDLTEDQLHTLVASLLQLEIDVKAEADRMDLVGRRGIKKVIKAGRGDIRNLLVSQHELAVRQQLDVCEALRDRRFRFIAEIDRKLPAPRGPALRTGEDVEAYLASLRKR